MKLSGLVDEDFINYKKPSMFIGFPNCSFKCDIEAGEQVCQNSTLATCEKIEFDIEKICKRFISNPITSAVVCGGLEPFDSWEELYDLIRVFRRECNNDIVIYTGYKEQEIKMKIDSLIKYPNIYIKFGRFIPNHEEHFDDVLGVYLASDNQYGKKIS